MFQFVQDCQALAKCTDDNLQHFSLYYEVLTFTHKTQFYPKLQVVSAESNGNCVRTEMEPGPQPPDLCRNRCVLSLFFFLVPWGLPAFSTKESNFLTCFNSNLLGFPYFPLSVSMLSYTFSKLCRNYSPVIALSVLKSKLLTL